MFEFEARFWVPHGSFLHPLERAPLLHSFCVGRSLRDSGVVGGGVRSGLSAYERYVDFLLRMDWCAVLGFADLFVFL